MRRTQSLKLSIANYSKTSAFCGRYSAKISNSQFATPRLLPWKGQTSPLPHTAAARRNLTREYFTEDRVEAYARIRTPALRLIP